MTLKGYYALCFKTRVSFEAHHENLNEDRPILSVTKMWTNDSIDSGNISFMRIFAGIPRKGGIKQQGVIENVDFRAFRRYVFGALGKEANINLLI